MKLVVKLFTCIAVTGAILISTPVTADQRISCKSRNHQYNMCRADTHGYVRLVKQHSRADCIQGRTWDYDRRGIWVDDNCVADFVIETRHHTDGHSEHKGKNAVAAVAAVALIAAVAASSNSVLEPAETSSSTAPSSRGTGSSSPNAPVFMENPLKRK